MSTLDVVAEVLREVAPRALKAREITALAGSRLPTASRTPETVVSRDLALDVRDRGAASRFLRVDRGAFVLKEALPTAFYNDNDKFAAQWTRNLAAAGEIAAGVVDERSIRDLKPADVASYRQFHAFSGIGIWSRALRDAGWSDDRPIWSGSAPCQPWSSAGRRRGEADDRHLWPEWFRLIRECRPPIVVGEQVASRDGYRWLDEVAGDFEGVGYTFGATELSAAVVGAPHRRQRIYFVAFLGARLGDVFARHVLSNESLDRTGATASGPGFNAIHARVEDEADAAGKTGGCGLFATETSTTSSDVMAYARERRREVVGAPWLHARGEPGNHDARRGEADVRGSRPVSHAAGARPRVPEDARADHRHEIEGAEAIEWRAARGLEPQRGRAPDVAGTLPDAERVVRDEGRIGGPHGRPALEPDRHGQVDGGAPRTSHLVGDAGGPRSQGGVPRSCPWAGTAGAGATDERFGTVELGDTCLPGSGRDAGEVHRAQRTGEGERLEDRDLADEPLPPGPVDGDVVGAAVVRGATDPARDLGFRPGDRIRIAGDPSWGGAVRGYWAQDVEWIYCRPEPRHKDGRWRPVIADVEPLAYGPAPGMGRTRAARLRGFGNAIVLPIATAFVASVIDALADDARRLGPPSDVLERVDTDEMPESGARDADEDAA